MKFHSLVIEGRT